MDWLGENRNPTVCVPKEGHKDIHSTKATYTSTKAIGIFEKLSGDYLYRSG